MTYPTAGNHFEAEAQAHTPEHQANENIVDVSLKNITELQSHIAADMQVDPNSAEATQETDRQLTKNAEFSAQAPDASPGQKEFAFNDAAIETALEFDSGISAERTPIAALELDGYADDINDVVKRFDQTHAVLPNGHEAAPVLMAAVDALGKEPMMQESSGGVEYVESNTEKLKADIDIIFQTHPELATVGTKEQYEAYLAGVFPDSKEKDIVYHGTAAKFDEFNTRPDRSHLSRYTSKAAFFTPDLALAQSYTGEAGEVKMVKLNLLNPKIYRKKSEGRGVDLSIPRSITDQVRADLEAQGFDGVVNTRTDGEIGVFESDAILTLGSGKDVQKFSEFVST